MDRDDDSMDSVDNTERRGTVKLHHDQGSDYPVFGTLELKK